MDEDDMNEEHYALDQPMLPPGEEPGLGFDDDEEYANVMGKSSKRGPQPRPSVQQFLKAKEMKKIESGNYEFKGRQEQMEDVDIMYGMDNLSEQEDAAWRGAEPAPSGSRRRNGGGRSRPADDDDWDAEGL